MPELKALHDKVDLLHVQQALMTQSVGTMSKTLEELVGLRNDTAVLLTKIDANKDDHDEMFPRIRALEDHTAACKIDRESTKKRTTKLENNQRWFIALIIGTLLTNAVKVFI